ncbi:MAG: signal peptide peptidase SppA [Sphingomonadaceae bacterium]
MTFLRTVWSILVGVKDALVLLLLLLLFGGLWALTGLYAPSAPVPSSGALTIQLDGTLVDEAMDISPAAVLSGTPIIRETEVRDVVRAIDTARDDSRIRMIVLDLDGFLGGGQANLEAVGEALLRFRQSGKRVESYASAYVDSGYFLAAHADRIWMSPLGAVILTGPGGSSLYFKEALDKLKVDVEVFRVGTYKSFVEPFTRNDRSPEARAADMELADDIWANYRAGIEAQRQGLDIDAMLTSLAQPHDGPRNFADLAVSMRLVDTLAGPVQFAEAVREQAGPGRHEDRPGDYASIDLNSYLVTRVYGARSGSAVGVVHVAGNIVDGEAPAGEAGGTTIAELIGRAVADKDIKAIVVRVDSGGGSVMASERIREALAAARAKGKPVVASFGPVAASGGYWVATAADAIYARPSTVTGSIGVFGILPTFERTLKGIGISTDSIGTTPFSGQPDLIGGINQPMRDVLQSTVSSTYNHFIQLVANARDLPAAQVEQAAEGRVWSGKRAKELQLIDEFGDLDAAVRDAARRAGIDDEDPRVKVMRRDRPVLLRLLIGSPGEQEKTGGDAFTRIANVSRARAIAGVQAAMGIATGAGIQSNCFVCAGYQPPRSSVPALPSYLKILMEKAGL